MLSYDEVNKKVNIGTGYDNVLGDHKYPRNEDEVVKLQEEKEKIQHKGAALKLFKNNFEYDKDSSKIISDALMCCFYMLQYAFNSIEYALTVNKGVKSRDPFLFSEGTDEKKDEAHRLYDDEKSQRIIKSIQTSMENIRDYLQENPSIINIIKEINNQIEKFVADPYSFDAKKSSQEVINASKQNIKTPNSPK